MTIHYTIALRDLTEQDEESTKRAREVVAAVAKNKGFDVVKHGQGAEGGAVTLVAQVTPEAAAEWVKRSVNGAPLRPETVTALAEQMKAGKWEERSDEHDVTFDTFGDLVGGQHRVHAVIESGCTVPMRITIGMPVKTFHLAKPRPATAARDYQPPTEGVPSEK